MQTIGTLLSTARKKKRLSLARLSEKTKIKQEFLHALECEEWQNLPDFATTSSFVRTIAPDLGLSQEIATAFLRRDFPTAKLKKTRKERILWTPYATYGSVILLTVGFIIFYLTKQYFTFVAPPSLVIHTQKDKNGSVVISGKTDKEARVLVNGEPVLLTPDGTFTISLVAPSGQTLTVEAISRSGKSTKKEFLAP